MLSPRCNDFELNLNLNYTVHYCATWVFTPSAAGTDEGPSATGSTPCA
jgi:hypothetical protein